MWTAMWCGWGLSFHGEFHGSHKEAVKQARGYRLDLNYRLEARVCGAKRLVELRGIEPLTSAVRLQRSPI
jgi:hypothetical protein